MDESSMSWWKCIMTYGWRLDKYVTQLQNQSFTSKYASWLLKKKNCKRERLKQKLLTDLDLHQKVNTMHASRPKYIYESVSPKGPLKWRPNMQACSRTICSKATMYICIHTHTADLLISRTLPLMKENEWATYHLTINTSYTHQTEPTI